MKINIESMTCCRSRLLGVSCHVMRVEMLKHSGLQGICPLQLHTYEAYKTLLAKSQYFYRNDKSAGVQSDLHFSSMFSVHKSVCFYWRGSYAYGALNYTGDIQGRFIIFPSFFLFLNV